MNNHCVTLIRNNAEYPFFFCNAKGKVYKVNQTENGVQRTVYRTFSTKYDYTNCNGYYDANAKELYLTAINTNDRNKILIIKSKINSIKEYFTEITYETATISLIYINSRIHIIYSCKGPIYVSHAHFVGDGKHKNYAMEIQ